MACDGNDYVTNFRDGLLVLEDGGGHSLEVPLDMGDIAISGLSADMTEVAVYQSRGRTVSVRKTTEVQPTVNFSAMLQRFGSSTTLKAALLDFVRGKGAYATNVRTSGICGDVYTLDARWQLTTADGTDYIQLRDVRFTADLAEGDPNTISLSGTVYNPDVTVSAAA